MPSYFTSEEIIKEQHNYLKNALKLAGSYFIRDGTIMHTVQTLCPPGGFILEVGTGNGRVAAALSKYGYVVYGLDIDNYVEESLQSQFKFVQCDLNTSPLPFADNELDCIIAPAIVEHLENGAFFLREAKRVLKQGGLLLFSMPNIFCLPSKWFFFKTGDFLSYAEENNHITLFPWAVLRKFTRGLKQEHIYYSRGWVVIFGKKIHLPEHPLLNKYFGRKLCYQFRKI
ncbi:MAG TPA: hypothetical protein DDW36_01050 [Candidatus Magasanikbacteria bacterium]|nr:hypothetical protein [Candidatus Magasanikbacteria bacterium]